MTKIIAHVQVRTKFGYNVAIVDEDGEIIEEYSAGDSRLDSQVYGTGDLDYKTLLKFAKQTAKEMLIDNDAEKPYVIIHEEWS